MSPAAELRDVSKEFAVRLPGGRRGKLTAVDGISLAIRGGSTLGLVGESGSGKSTAARLLLRLIDPTSGQIHLGGEDITTTSGRPLRMLRRRMQFVFQDPYSSFDPRVSIGASIGEALRRATPESESPSTRTAELLETVGLPPTLGERRPPHLSGGQLQRAAIARAMAVSPSLIALDEPLSSLDVSSQAHIADLLERVQLDLGVSYLFITHDLSAVRQISHDLAVMYLGRIVESGPTKTVFTAPRHPYTQALLAAVPRVEAAGSAPRQRPVLQGDIPSVLQPPSGCRFHTRCPYAMEICRHVEPPMTTAPDGVSVACHLSNSHQGAP